MGEAPDRIQPMIDPSSQPFWEGARQRRLLVQRDPRTGQLHWPPRPRLPPDWTQEPEWVEVSGRGRVWSYSVIHRSSHAAPATPYVLAVVELDEGLFMTSNIVGADPAAVCIGLEVKVQFEPTGEELMLPVFAPV
jgi:uncharacterized OB-fold protein